MWSLTRTLFGSNASARPRPMHLSALSDRELRGGILEDLEEYSSQSRFAVAPAVRFEQEQLAVEAA